MFKQQSFSQFISFSLVVMLIVTVSAVPTLAQDSEVAIEVNGEVVQKSELDQRVKRAFERMKNQYGDRMKNEEMQETMQKRVRKQVIDQTVDQLLLKTNAKQSDVSVSGSEVQERIQSQKNRFGKEEQFEKALQNQGMTIDDLREKVREDLMVQKFLDENMGEVSVSNEEIRQFFEENESRFNGKSFDEAKPSIKRILKRRKQQDKRQQLVDKLRKQSEVDVRV